MKPKVPSIRTLAKYGLSKAEWRTMLRAQGGVCGICGREMLKSVIDHEHRAGWKKMPASERKKYVRGILHSFCNYRYLPYRATPEILRGAADYLERYESRKP